MRDRVTPRTELRDELITITRMLLNQPPAVRGDLPPPAEVPPAPAPETPAPEQAEAEAAPPVAKK